MAETKDGSGATSAAVADGHGAVEGYARSSVRERVHDVKDQARVKGREAKDAAARKAGELKQEATRRADELTSRIGGRVDVLARALRRAGEEMRQEGEARFAELTDDAAMQVERFGSYLDGRSPNAMISDLERMARENPAFFVGGTFALGLLTGRFLRAGEPAQDAPAAAPGGAGDGSEWDGPRMHGSPPANEDGDLVEEIGMGPVRTETPDVETLSDLRPSLPSPGGPRERGGEDGR